MNNSALDELRFSADYARSRQSRFVGFLRRLLSARMAAPSLVIVVIVVLAAIFAPWISPHDPLAQDPFHGLANPTWNHLLGTDQLGRDSLSRLIYGSRVALAVGFGAVAFGVVIGMPIGVVSGYLRGAVDDVLMRVMDAIVAFPGLVLALALVSVRGASLGNVIFAIGVGNIPYIARITRSEALAIRGRDYVLAAEATGATSWRIMFSHVMPNTLAPVIVQSTLGMAYAVLASAGLSFLGVGVPQPTPSWGSDLQFAFGFMSIQPLVAIVPGVAIFALVLAFNILGDAFRDVLDPRLRGSI